MDIGPSKRFSEIRAKTTLNKQQFADSLDIPSTTVSDIELGKREPSKDVLMKLTAIYDINLHWMLTGEGEMYAKSQVPEEAVKGEKQEKVFVIPFLTKEQALNFDHNAEIPDPKAHSGDYPKEIFIPVSLRVKEYGTDLRAIAVFNNRMDPILTAGDVAVFEATGWNGDGVYVYRNAGELHITHVKFTEGKFRLTKEFKPEEEIPYDAETFTAIGRVRAVVKEVR